MGFSFNMRRCAYGLIILALLLQDLIPQGFMPAAKMQIEICTASGLAAVMVDADHAPVRHNGKHDSCPFAPVLGHSFVAARDMPVFAVARESLFFFAAFVLPRVFSRPYFSQGPPVF